MDALNLLFQKESKKPIIILSKSLSAVLPCWVECLFHLLPLLSCMKILSVSIYSYIGCYNIYFSFSAADPLKVSSSFDAPHDYEVVMYVFDED